MNIIKSSGQKFMSSSLTVVGKMINNIFSLSFLQTAAIHSPFNQNFNVSFSQTAAIHSPFNQNFNVSFSQTVSVL